MSITKQESKLYFKTQEGKYWTEQGHADTTGMYHTRGNYTHTHTNIHTHTQMSKIGAWAKLSNQFSTIRE